MSETEARITVLRLIKEFDIYDEMWLGLCMHQVNKLVMQKTGKQEPLSLNEVRPDLVLARSKNAMVSIADELLRFRAKHN